MTDVVVRGTGGHARSCLDVVDPGTHTVHGCVGPPPAGSLQTEYLGGDDALAGILQAGVRTAFVAVGDNATRRQLAAETQALGFALATFIAPTARVSPTASIGPGSVVMHGAVVGAYARLGEGVIVNTSASVDHDCVVEDFAHLAPGTHLAGNVLVGAGAFLGVGVSVVPHRRIGEWSTVGAGATVIRDVPKATTAVGTPAVTREDLQ